MGDNCSERMNMNHHGHGVLPKLRVRSRSRQPVPCLIPFLWIALLVLFKTEQHDDDATFSLSLFPFAVAVALTTTSSHNNHNHMLRPIPRIPASEFNPHVHYLHPQNYETPVIVEGALTALDCEEMCDALVGKRGSNVIEMQRKRSIAAGPITSQTKSSSRTDMYSCTLEQALEAMMQSKHSDAVFSFCEGLLDDDNNGGDSDDDDKNTLAEFRKTLTSCREALFQEDAGGNWFDHFPASVRPSDCVVLAGEGATSTLHRDPFEWTGTSLCLEGTKVWRFVPPPGALLCHENEFGSNDNDDMDSCSGVGAVDEALNAYRLNSVAWDKGDDTGSGSNTGVSISAGWQSDLSLYAERDESVPTARELSELEEEEEEESPHGGGGQEKKLNLIQSIAADSTKLLPSPNINKATAASMWTGVQRPGDLIVIPAYWWHQTYAMEPSLAVASQRCGSTRDAARVVRHILDTARAAEQRTTEIPSLLQQDTFDGVNPRTVVDQLFRYLHDLDE
jgi:hypothetical protein